MSDGLNYDVLKESILNELKNDSDLHGKSIIDDIIEQLSEVTTSGVQINEDTGEVTRRSDQKAFVFNNDNLKTMNYNNKNYTGLEVIVEIIVNKIVQELVDVMSRKIVDHIKNNLKVTIPSGTVITQVTGQAAGVLNINPIVLSEDDID
ncbi:MAG: hypothetical protein ACOCZ5_00235 [bacterium]